MASPVRHICRHLLLLLLLLPPSLTDDVISIAASLVPVEKGHTVEVECTSTEDKTPRWFFGANATGPPIPEDGSQRISSDALTGTLTVKAAMLNDTGTYLCQTVSGEHGATFDLRVYEMPSYETEGIIIIVICIVLLVAVVGGMLYQVSQKRKKDQKSQAKLRARTPPQRET